MIVARPKSFEDIKRYVGNRKKVAIVGCGGCVTVRPVGGQKQVQELAALLRLWAKKEALTRGSQPLTIEEETILRQCEPEFINSLEGRFKDCEAIISLACGVGVQCLADKFPELEVFPGVDAVFMGATIEPGLYWERCVGCGNCIIGETGGLCPVSRCAKSLLNGPCGGSLGGHCEVSPETPCVWQLIYERMEQRGNLGALDRIMPIKDWSVRPGRLVLEHLRVEKKES
ncbi:MAG TPA: methylenetetrahydrofolate reductase C-terminal domain-containing protein [Candidatus Hypogeohydataceae bacterium YC38]|nr:methylenetetrahydrofolate reductase C-terminal domain-containing protein [Candidatus Brocadiales bacterium]